MSALSATATLLALTCQSTLLRPGFASQAVANVDGYERLYSDVLPSPPVRDALRRELSALPVDATYITANLRLVLPPQVLEHVMARLERQYLEVLTGRRSGLDALSALQPVVDQATTVIVELLPGIGATTPRLTRSSLTTFQRDFDAWLSRLRDGRMPVSLPQVTLSATDVARVTTILTMPLSESERSVLTAPVRNHLRLGDLSGALAVVLPHYLDARVLSALRDNVDTAVRALSQALPKPRQAQLSRRLFVPLASWWFVAVTASLWLSCLLLATGRSTRRVIELRAHLVLGWLLAAASGVLLWRWLPDPLHDIAQPVSGSRGQLLADVDEELRTQVASAYGLLLAAWAIIGLFAVVTARSLTKRHQPVLSRLAFGAAVSALSTAAGFVLLTTPAAPAVCNGSQRLCSRGYDEVTYLTSHNAMSNSSSGFISANQDPSLTGQLDNGVRALMLDLHYWTAPDQLVHFTDSLSPAMRSAWAPALTQLTPRDGVWLCHVVCQLGAVPAVNGLRSIAAWLGTHRSEVVTLILEDHVSEADLRATLRDAGLLRFVATPPIGGAPWPTLGRMITTKHRLVVFAERARPTEGWLRNLYEYAAETPYQARSAKDLNCLRGRGPETAPLFLLNNWISTPAPSRAEAAQVNAATPLRRRVATCTDVRGMEPTFIAVDFAQTGDASAVIDDLNGYRR